MQGYRRGERCEFCDEPGLAACPRCQCQVCEAHAASAGLCSMCRKEARDDAELERFRRAVLTDGARGPAHRGQATASLVAAIAGALGRWIFAREAGPDPSRRPFAERTPEDIRAWRRAAGVRTRC